MYFFKKIGRGSKTMLAFHGIGQDCRCFEALAEVLQNEYTFYLIDLPFHGQTAGLQTEKMTNQDLWKEIEELLSQEKINKFSVAGFSMGGKFALSIAKGFAPQIDSLWLFAPDGVTESIWYKLATRFWVTKKAFRFLLQKLSYFTKFSTLLLKLRLVSKSNVRFAQSSLTTESQREQVYRSWVGFSLICTSMTSLAQSIAKNNTDIRIFLGKTDALLPHYFMKPLISKLVSFDLTVLQTGHHRLVEKVAESFKAVS